jgi:hypothetical protein
MKLYAPAAYWSMHPKDKEMLCSEENRKKFYFINNKILWIDITEAINILMYMYHIGRDRFDLEGAHNVFMNNIVRIIESKMRKYFWKKLNPIITLCLYIASKYYNKILNYGPVIFWENKNSSLRYKDINDGDK